MSGMAVSSQPSTKGENTKFRATWGQARQGKLSPGKALNAGK